MCVLLTAVRIRGILITIVFGRRRIISGISLFRLHLGSLSAKNRQSAVPARTHMNLRDGSKPEVGVSKRIVVSQLSLGERPPERRVSNNKEKAAWSHSSQISDVWLEMISIFCSRQNFHKTFVIAKRIHTENTRKMPQSSPSSVLLSWISCFFFSFFLHLFIVFCYYVLFDLWNAYSKGCKK